jgi:hypothetical protein
LVGTVMAGSGPTLNQVTYNNSVTLSLAVSVLSSTGLLVAIYYALESQLPASGTYNIIVTSSGSTTYTGGGSISLLGAAQTAPGVTKSVTAASAASIATTITTIAANAWLFDFVGVTPGTTLTPIYTSMLTNPSSSNIAGAGGLTTTTTPGINNAGWNSSPNFTLAAEVIASIAPYGGAGPGNSVLFGCDF